MKNWLTRPNYVAWLQTPLSRYIPHIHILAPNQEHVLGLFLPHTPLCLRMGGNPSTPNITNVVFILSFSWPWKSVHYMPDESTRRNRAPSSINQMRQQGLYVRIADNSSRWTHNDHVFPWCALWRSTNAAKYVVNDDVATFKQWRERTVANWSVQHNVLASF